MSDLQRSPGGTPRRWRGVPPRFTGPVFAVWTAGWITAFALHQPEIGIPMLFGTGALGAVLGRGRGRARRRPADQRWRVTEPEPLPYADDPAPAPAPAPERALVAAVLRAETNAHRFDPDSLALVRELEGLLRPMLATLRARGGDADVRHDVEAIATEHLPAVLDAYLALPADAAHRPAPGGGASPAAELHSQLTLLVEGCTQLRDALREADVHRQQQLGRFLEAKFRRSDLEL